ncbi:MAG: peptidyl-tRNA hydrolase Pth2 [Candidatus Norongarragalinales archaeon]
MVFVAFASLKQALVVRSDLGMGRGKIAAQCAHASLLALEKAGAREVAEWKAAGAKKIVVKVSSESELTAVFNKAKKARLPCALVRDAGFTQVAAGTPTAVGIGPAEESKIDAVTGKLKLL